MDLRLLLGIFVSKTDFQRFFFCGWEKGFKTCFFYLIREFGTIFFAPKTRTNLKIAEFCTETKLNFAQLHCIPWNRRKSNKTTYSNSNFNQKNYIIYPDEQIFSSLWHFIHLEISIVRFFVLLSLNPFMFMIFLCSPISMKRDKKYIKRNDIKEVFE